MNHKKQFILGMKMVIKSAFACTTFLDNLIDRDAMKTMFFEKL